MNAYNPQNRIENAVQSNRPVGTSSKVVGWLVCTGGGDAGACFNLYDKQNSVGSGAAFADKLNTGEFVRCDIELTRDKKIAPKHALIAYDPRHNRFTLVPRTEADRMSLNGTNVSKAVILKSFDRIRMGGSDFIFVALCGDQFKWDF